MRPIKLTIEGINSFISSQTVDFESVGENNLFCISGSTGSGKTTILDCIILALYNNHGERGNLTDYVNLRCESGRIEFTFELLGEVYQTVRVLSKKEGKNSMLLKKIGQEIPIAEGKKAYDFLTEKIGLTVSEFTNVVVLQQGRFAKFLKADKKDRIDLINKLFDLRRFEHLYSKFNAKAQEQSAVVKGYENSLALFEEVTDEAVKTVGEEYEKLKTEGDVSLDFAKKEREIANKIRDGAKKYADFLKAQEEIERANAELERCKEREEKKKEYDARLIERERALKENEGRRDEMVERLSELKNALISLTETKEKLDKIRERLIKIESEKTALKNGIAEVEELLAKEQEITTLVSSLKKEIDYRFTGDDEADGRELSALLAIDKTTATLANKNLVESRQKRNLAREELEKLRTQWSLMQSVHARLEIEERQKREESEKLSKAYEDALNANAAYRVQSSLAEGDLCPVCGNHLVEKPALDCADLDGIKKESELAKSSHDDALAELQKSSTALFGINERVNGAMKALDEAEEAVRKATKDSNEWTSGQLEEREERVKKFVEALSERASIVKRREQKQSEVKISEETIKIKEATALADEQESKKAKLKAEEVLGERGEEEIKNIQISLDLLTKERETLDKDKASANKATVEIERAKQTALVSLENAKTRLNPCEKITEEMQKSAEERAVELEKKHEELLVKIEGKRKDYEHIQAKLADKKSLLKSKAEAEKSYKRYHDMATLFYRNAFNEFVAAEFVKEFTALASAQLGELTGGKYSLDYDEESGDFFVRDFLSNNDARSVKTLSGGETFLASLSLAIAISKELSRNKNYEFFFIDEGFGTLSPDSIDMVVNALISLSRETLVGVITHRGELIEHIEKVVFVDGANEEEGSKITQ